MSETIDEVGSLVFEHTTNLLKFVETRLNQCCEALPQITDFRISLEWLQSVQGRADRYFVTPGRHLNPFIQVSTGRRPVSGVIQLARKHLLVPEQAQANLGHTVTEYHARSALTELNSDC